MVLPITVLVVLVLSLAVQPDPIHSTNLTDRGGNLSRLKRQLQNEDCSERNIEYTGDDLNIPNNGVNNKQNNKNRCRRSCRNTPGCNFWVYVHKREEDVNLRKACFLKSNKRTSSKRRRRISGPKSCDAAPGAAPGAAGNGDLLVNVYDGSNAPPPSALFCKTNFAPTSPSPNQRCVFPFIYNNKMYHGCTLDGSTDGKPWCSVRVDANGNHVSGQGLYGQCFDNCPNDFAGTPVSGVVTRPPFVPGGGGGRPPVVTYPTPTPTPRPTPRPTARPPIFTPPQQPSLPLKECGNNARRFQTKIVGGRPADPNEWPWLAALIRPSSRNSGQYCGGTLISDRFILTAAHCLAPYRKEQLKVTLGEYNFETQGETLDQTYLVSNMKMHENYDGRTYDNDIALIKLDRPVTFSKSVYPICLPPRGKSYVNTRAFVIGWGTIYFGGPSSSTLQEVNVRVWDNAQCSANYQRLNRVVTSKMLCAGEEDRDSCQGDSGGPLNCLNFQTGRWELCGVVSWGARCAEPDFPGVYTKVTDYLDWIESNQSSL